MRKRVLLDTGIFIHAEFAEPTVKNVRVGWGGRESVLEVHGLKSKKPGQDADYQKQKEALFTVGRLIREGEIEAYTSIEIDFERFRGTVGIQEFNALRGCQIHKCVPALDRSRFRKTANFTGFIAKGGKKDQSAGLAGGEETQIAFLEWLCARPTMLERLDRTCRAHRPKPVRNREFGNTQLVSIALQEVRERRELPGCFPSLDGREARV